MKKEIPQKLISWREAYRVGFSVALNHKVFSLLTIFSLACERSISFFAHYTGISFKDIFLEYQNMILVFSNNPLSGNQILSQFKELFVFLLVAIVLFIIGVFILIGVLGLMRDLLIKHGYKTEDVFIRGKRYFWPIIKFKVPIYTILSVILIIIANFVIPKQNDKIEFIIYLSIGILIYACAFFLARIVLSLGPKIIVTEEVKNVSPLYKFVVKLIYPYLKQVAIFYCLMFIITAISILLPIGLSLLKIPFIPLVIISFLILSFLTVVMKASSFSLYLQLRSLPCAVNKTTKEDKISETNMNQTKLAIVPYVNF